MMTCEGGRKCCRSHWLAWVLLVVGGLNWGLVGLGSLMGSHWNLVKGLLGSWPTVEAIVYILVGASAVMLLIGCRCSTCRPDAPMQ